MPDPIAEFESRLIPAVRVRSFDDVVAQLRAVLLSGELRAEDKLPSERELTRMPLRTAEARGLPGAGRPPRGAVRHRTDRLIVSVVGNNREDWSFGLGRAQFLEGDL